MEMITQTGYCKFCGEGRMVDALEDSTQEWLNQLATDECTCKEAYAERERAQQRESAECEIERIIAPRSASAAEIFRRQMENIQRGLIKEIVFKVIAPESKDKWTLAIRRTAGGLNITAKTTFTEDIDIY